MLNWKTLHIPIEANFKLPDSIIVYGRGFPRKPVDLEHLLSVDELEKYNKLKNPIQSDLQKSCRAVLKTLLSTYTGIPVNKIVLKKNRYGKPYLENSGIFFNVSHTDTAFIIYISRKGRTGVDMENVIPTWDFALLSDYAFTYDEKKLINNQRDFFYFWTMKEALLKAVGFGLINRLSETDSLKLISKYQLFAHTFVCPGSEIATIVCKHKEGRACCFVIN